MRSGRMWIFIEMHGRFNPITAIEMMRQLAPFRPGWFEEPVPPDNLQGPQEGDGHGRPLGVPIATGERLHTLYQCRELFEYQAADILQVDISHFGGLKHQKLAGWAEAYYMLVAPHNVGGPVSTAAALHFAAATHNFKIQEELQRFRRALCQRAVTGLPEVVDGYFPLPNGPGLGVTLNEDVIQAHPRQQVHFNLFSQDWHKRDVAGKG